MTRSALLHLRIPFSFFLMPVYFFALSISPNLNGPRLGWSLLLLHLFLYPASNGFNSYFDRDEKSIGGLKNPPPVSKDLYYLSLLFDIIAIVLGWLYVSQLFAVMVVIYGLASKAYSHPFIRLKKYPVAGWLTVAFFQGFFTFVMCYAGINDFPLENLFREKVVFCGVLTSFMLGGSYPLTQIYQHEEDAKRGDRTMSMLLGIRGTFLFAIGSMTVALVLFLGFFLRYYEWMYFLKFLLALAPALLFFQWWMWRSWTNETAANYSSTMWQNFLSAAGLNAFFIYFFLETSHILQL